MFKNNHTSLIRFIACVLTFLVSLSAPFFPALAAQEGENSRIAALRAKAEQGDADAQFELGDAYFQGANGVAKNPSESIKWLRKAADQGNARAQGRLGYAYKLGFGVPKNNAEAVKWWRKAAEQGLDTAQFGLATAYARGEGVAKDPVEAEKWYRKAAEQGEVRAQRALAQAARAAGSQSTQPAASKSSTAGTDDIAALRAKAEQGDAEAQYNLGYAYHFGKGVSLDLGNALKWYRKSAAQGFAKAQNALGEAYRDGTGFPKTNGGLPTKNWVEAVKWWRKAADQGNITAQYNLGNAYISGFGGLRKNQAEAAKWLGKAADQGSVPARRALDGLPERFANASPPPPEQWLHLKGEHCSMFTCGDAEKAKADLVRIEQFYAAFCAVVRPGRMRAKDVTVVCFANRDQFLSTCKNPENAPGGICFYRDSENFIKIYGFDYRILVHEYTHHLMNRIFGQVGGAFISEGLATFFEETEIEGDIVSIGAARTARGGYLNSLLMGRQKGTKLIPMETLAESFSKHYAQVWLFMHYLLVGRQEGRGLNDIAKYATLRREKSTVAQAFKSAFGVSLDEMDKALARYLDDLASNSQAQDTITLTIPAAPIAAKITIEPANKRALQNALGEITGAK